jgi:SAM-dependent methyltransferase
LNSQFNDRATAADDLSRFYSGWSNKELVEIDFDVESAARKAEAIFRILPKKFIEQIHSMLDYGCGYGAVLHRLTSLIGNISYEKLPSLEIKQNIPFIKGLTGEKIDVILLIDLLEHVPDCHELIKGLSEVSEIFLIKLPLECSIFDNYILPKEYPSSVHSNGHLREFDANNVHYFIRGLGLTPMHEALYRYELSDSFPPISSSAPWRQRCIRFLIMSIKEFLGILMPKKLYLRLIGGGGYICLASYNKNHVLNPS